MSESHSHYRVKSYALVWFFLVSQLWNILWFDWYIRWLIGRIYCIQRHLYFMFHLLSLNFPLPLFVDFQVYARVYVWQSAHVAKLYVWKKNVLKTFFIRLLFSCGTEGVRYRSTINNKSFLSGQTNKQINKNPKGWRKEFQMMCAWMIFGLLRKKKQVYKRKIYSFFKVKFWNISSQDFLLWRWEKYY